MKIFSLRTLIDDILLLVRNNNISESEDLSRTQIASWILAYRSLLVKQALEKDKASGEDSDDSTLESLKEMRGPLELEDETSLDGVTLLRRITKDEITDLADDNANNIYCVFDQEGNVIQKMSRLRKFYHLFRKYTAGELTYEYENKHIYIHGEDDKDTLRYIWLTGIFSSSDISDDVDEDDITIPDWMVPDIRLKIMQNELSFMLQRPSDDDNNSTLDGIKPQPGAVTPNEK